jgi:hypothetical protein
MHIRKSGFCQLRCNPLDKKTDKPIDSPIAADILYTYFVKFCRDVDTEGEKKTRRSQRRKDA